MVSKIVTVKLVKDEGKISWHFSQIGQAGYGSDDYDVDTELTQAIRDLGKELIEIINPS